ncbi:MAG TPA: hypothetical protein PLQ49_01760 [Methanothrix sp.]|nr:hypothetical protein [Methanothrix sp.]HRW82069.1 hypothetical protein [Methanothrix sp.]
MKIILTALIIATLLVGMGAVAKTPIDLSTLDDKAEIKSSMTPMVISYTPDVPKTTMNAVDVRTLGRSFGTFAGSSMEPLEIGASNPITVTPGFSISKSNRTLSMVTVYTPPFSISKSNRTLSQVTTWTPEFSIFGGA